jgi:hypothetical protein
LGILGYVGEEMTIMRRIGRRDIKLLMVHMWRLLICTTKFIPGTVLKLNGVLVGSSVI